MTTVTAAALAGAGLTLPLTAFVPARARPWLQIGVGAAFYALLAGPAALGTMAAVAVAIHALAPGVVRGSAVSRRLGLWVGILLALAPLVASRVDLRLGGWVSGVGVSFFAFQAIGYLIDLYQGGCRAPLGLRDLLFLFFFFPRVLQGPIERAASFAAQTPMLGTASYEQWRSGLVLIAWGALKKTVVADRIGLLVDQVYGHSSAYPPTVVWVAVVAFAIQIYADFSGYTDMARGAARVLGLTIAQNFDRPYMAVSIADFWRRWHISLSRWLLAYVFMPLQRTFGGRSAASYAAAIIVTFLVCGLWHGAGWTFVAWGLLNGVWLAVNRGTEAWRDRIAARAGIRADLRRAWRVGLTFIGVCAAWAVFRAESLSQAWRIWASFPEAVMGAPSGLPAAAGLAMSMYERSESLTLGLGLMAIAAVDIGRSYTGLAGAWAVRPTPLRWAIYYGIILGLIIGYTPVSRPFIYFAF